MSDSQTLYKLIILYMLEQLDFPLTNSQITDFVLEKEYTNYFSLQQTINELVESKLIDSKTIHNQSYYHLSEEGQQTLYYLKDKLTDAIITDIDTYFKEHKYKMRNDVSVLADYYKTTDHDYAAQCRILEKGIPILDLTLTAPTDAVANTICNNWKEEHEEIYRFVVEHLMKQKEVREKEQ